MAQKKKAIRHIPAKRITLSPAAARELMDMENAKMRLHAEAMSIEQMQLAKLTTIVISAGAGPFMAEQWNLENIGPDKKDPKRPHGFIERK